MSLTEMRSYEGRMVRITFDYDDPAAQVNAKLISITDDGEVEYDKNGLVMYGWPCLAVAPLCAWKNCENIADPARPGSGPFDGDLCQYHDEIQEGDPPYTGNI